MAAKTTYLVLRLERGGWQPDGAHQTAGSADQAVRQAAALRAETDTTIQGEFHLGQYINRLYLQAQTSVAIISP